MALQKSQLNDPAKILQHSAILCPDVEEGIACAGTALERRTFKVNKKAFLFLGTHDAMLKLNESLPAASQYASSNPNTIKVGAGGWVKLIWKDGAYLPKEKLKVWVTESYWLFAPKKKIEKTLTPIPKKKKSQIKKSAKQSHTRSSK